jgi:hypothetical protein
MRSLSFCTRRTLAQSTFRRTEQPSVSLARPPVGWHRTVAQDEQTTTDWACEKTVVLRGRARERDASATPRPRPSEKAWRGQDSHLEAARALDVHEEAVGALHQALQLVDAGLMVGGGVEEVEVGLRAASVSACFAARPRRSRPRSDSAGPPRAAPPRGRARAMSGGQHATRLARCASSGRGEAAKRRTGRGAARGMRSAAQAHAQAARRRAAALTGMALR